MGRASFSGYHPLLQGQDSPDDKAKRLNQKGVDDHEKQLTETWARDKQKRRPWHRAGSESEPPSESSDPTNGDKNKGRLLTTPTRLLKLILPLPFHPDKADRTQHDSEKSAEANKAEELEEIQPLALLIHPQQPLSYLERLLQAEIPPIRDGDRERIPNIVFRAEADLGGEKRFKDTKGVKDVKNAKDTRGGDGNVASYSGLGREGPERSADESNWVRWSSSTEIGDFIRDAARGREFSLDIEGYSQKLRVAVPSFNDRTYYMRLRLRKMSKQVQSQAKIKEDCDKIAYKGAHRLAQGGFGVLIGWWGVVYYVTFHTDFGWDLVEPVTYLVGLTTIIGGYMWFLYISRDLSYKAALNVTVSRRQQALYQERGFDPDRWNSLVQEANSLRHEIKMVANEYDVDWDEARDLGGDKIKEVLENEKNGRRRKQSREQEEQEEEEEEEDDEESSKERDEPRAPPKGEDSGRKKSETKSAAPFLS